MSFTDVWENCRQCGNRFVLTVELQRHVAKTGVERDLVLLCPACAPRREGGVPQSEMRLDPVTGHWVGSIKWFDLDKGYGFIDRGNGTDIFFHRSSVIGSAADFVEAQMVTYGVEETLKGLQAIEVRLFEL